MKIHRAAAFTLMEMLVSMGASSIILGGLMLSSMAMQKSLTGSEKYAVAYSDQRRLIDFIGRDLRRSIGVEATDASGTRAPVTAGTITISDGATLILSLPGYYRSNVKNTAAFDQALDVVGTEERLDYGTTTALADPVEVSFRRVLVPPQKCICFVRREAGVDDIIVRAAENLFVEVSVLQGSQTATIKSWFRAPYSRAAPLVTTYDRLLLRNPPLDLKP
jgi:hypothetical protein